MAYSASTDMTAAWHAAAPPPPPGSSHQQQQQQQQSTSPQPTMYGMNKSSSSSSLGFDKRARGDSFPTDSHSPEPERPVSRNAMAKIREKERQRARTNSTSSHYNQQPGPPPQANVMPAMSMASGQQQQGGGGVGYNQYNAPVTLARERHDSSPAAAAPWSTYPQQASYDYTQVPVQAGPHVGYYQQQAYPPPTNGAWSQQPGASQSVYGVPIQPSPTGYENPAWPTMAGPSVPVPHHSNMNYSGFHAPVSQVGPPPQQSPWMGHNNVGMVPSQQASVPFPTNPMPPPSVPASYYAGVQVPYANATPPPSNSRPLPSPSRSSSVSSSVGTGPSSPSLGSISGTVRRSLPKPPGKPLNQAVTTDPSPSPLGRHDSVRMAAEEMMSRGVPRRKNMSVGSRFTESPNISKSDGSINEGKSAIEQSQRNGGRVARAESGSCLEKEMREMKLKEERRQSTSSMNNSVVPPPQEIMRAASPRPIRAAPQPAPEVSIVSSVEDVIPARPVSRGPKDERERRRSTNSFEASAAQVPIIFSPPPDTKPPMPTFSFDEAPVLSQLGMPSIVLPGDEVPAIQVDDSPSIVVNSAPSIEVESPMIHVSSEGSEDSEESEGPKASISISVSSSNIPQRSTTTTNLSHNCGSHQHHHHHDHHQNNQHAHDYSSRHTSAAPASASSVGSGASCATCQKWIGGRVVHAMSLTFHPDCFVCCHCSEHLEHVAFYEHEGRPYCHFDYHELFSKRCFHCRTPIVDQRYITINDVDLVGGNAEERCYHDLHFFCANCGDPFLDPKVASSAAGSDPMEMVEDEDGKVRFGGREFVVHKGYPYCEKCHVNLHKPRCKGCKKPILETDFLTALKAKWHLDCFCCEFCSKPISSENFFVKNGQAYDEDCYKIKLRSEL